MFARVSLLALRIYTGVAMVLRVRAFCWPTRQIHIARGAGAILRTYSSSASNAHTIESTVDGVIKGSIKASELVRETLRRIDEQDGQIGAFVAVEGDKALNVAEVIDNTPRDNKANRKVPLLLGLPIAIKDNICTEGIPTTASSKVLQRYSPSYDATSIARLKDAGAIIIGKTNMDEFGMGSTTESSAYQVTRNPRDTSRSPGGSSGGSAAAVASRMVLAALGTDTGGSIRQPAAWTGVVGLKPSYGRVSRSGLIAYGSSTDVIGPLTHNVRDAARLLEVLGAGPDRLDATTSQTPAVGDLLGRLGQVEQTYQEDPRMPLKGVRVGLIRETLQLRVQDGVAQSIRQAVDLLSDLGAQILEVSIPYLDQHCASYYVNVLSEASANLARFDGIRYGLRAEEASSAKSLMLQSRKYGLGEEVKQRILLGTFSLSAGYADAYYQKSQQLRAILARSFHESFQTADILVSPTSPTVAYPLGQADKSKVDMYADDLFTVPASLAGLPAISLPVRRETQKQLPVGLQIIGKTFRESDVLAVARAFELASADDR